MAPASEGGEGRFHCAASKKRASGTLTVRRGRSGKLVSKIGTPCGRRKVQKSAGKPTFRASGSRIAPTNSAEEAYFITASAIAQSRRRRELPGRRVRAGEPCAEHHTISRPGRAEKETKGSLGACLPGTEVPGKVRPPSGRRPLPYPAIECTIFKLHASKLIIDAS